MNITHPTTTREAILTVIRENPGITHEQMAVHPLIGSVPEGGLRPGRMRLWLAGIIEPDSEAAWAAALANRLKTVGWRVVDDAARRTEVAARAATRKTRNAELKAEERAKKIVEALQDSTVNRLVLQMTKDGPGSRRAIRHAEKVLKQQHAEARQRARQAERDKAANAEFLGMLANLWDARGAIAAADTHLIEERARLANGDQRRISDADWLVALRDVHIIISSFGTMWKNIRDLGGQNAPCPACGAPQTAETRRLGVYAVDADADAEEITDAEVVEAEIPDTKGLAT